MAEVSETKTTGTNLISKVNQSGSGIELGNLVESLVEAETSPKQSKLNDKVESTNLQISSYGQLSSSLSSLSSSLTTLETTNSRSTSSSGTAISLTLTNEADADDINSSMVVSSIAKGQVITFDLTSPHMLNSSSLSNASAIDSGTIAFVLNSKTTTITIDTNNNTVQGLVNEINKSGMIS